MQKLLLLLFFVVGFVQCNTCDNCEPFAEEPYLKLRFYMAEDNSSNVVIMDSINHEWAGNFSYYQDTVNTYLLPLNMNEDTSNFIITYRDTTDLDSYLTNTLLVKYERNYLKRSDNNILVVCNILETTSNFTSKYLLCADSLNTTCNSNEAIYQVFR